MEKNEPSKRFPKKPKFGRMLVPPEKFHTTKKGLKGYSRDEQKRLAREAQDLRDDPME
jgi:hypothetical protein